MFGKKEKVETTNQPQTEEKTESVTLDEALKEEGEGQTPETVSKKREGTSKSVLAMKIMESEWDNIQSGKVKRKDIIQRFIDEVGLTKAGASTYYGNIKKKLSKAA